MGSELIAPVLGLVIVCLIGIIGGAFLVSWLKEVLQKEWNRKYGKSPNSKSQYQKGTDPHDNIYQATASNIYQCATCTKRILVEPDSIIEIEPDRSASLPLTPRAGLSELDNTISRNRNDLPVDPNAPKIRRSQSHETLLESTDRGPGTSARSPNPVYTSQTHQRVRKMERAGNIRSEDLTRYESILKSNAARSPCGWTMVRQKDSDEEYLPVAGSGIRTSLSWSDLSRADQQKEFAQKKGKPYPPTKGKSNSFSQQAQSPANRNYYEYKKPDQISYIYSPKQDPSMAKGPHGTYATNKHPMQMANRAKLTEQGKHGVRGTGESMYQGHYQQLRLNSSDLSMPRNISSSSNTSSTTDTMSNQSHNNLDPYQVIDTLPLPPLPDDDEPPLPTKAKSLNPPPSVSPNEDEPKLPSYEESINDLQLIDHSNCSTPTLTPPTPYV